jgi:hypothetical protein
VAQLPSVSQTSWVPVEAELVSDPEATFVESVKLERPGTCSPDASEAVHGTWTSAAYQTVLSGGVQLIVGGVVSAAGWEPPPLWGMIRVNFAGLTL